MTVMALNRRKSDEQDRWQTPQSSSPAAPCLTYFGPATIRAVLGSEVELGTDSAGVIWARLAIAQSYRPAVGDLVLAIASGAQCYVIGVLEGQGATVLEAPGDLELRAPRGSVRITAAEGCELAAPIVTVAADTLELRGETLREEFDTIRRRIAGLLEVRAREICTAVSETWRLAGRRIVARGADRVTIDAPAIDLG